MSSENKPKFVFIGGPFDGQIRMKEVDTNAEDTSGMELIPGFEGDTPDTSYGRYCRIEGSDNEYQWNDS